MLSTIIDIRESRIQPGRLPATFRNDRRRLAAKGLDAILGGLIIFEGRTADYGSVGCVCSVPSPPERLLAV